MADTKTGCGCGGGKGKPVEKPKPDDTKKASGATETKATMH